MAISTPPDIAAPSQSPLPTPFSTVLWARDIANQGNVATVVVPAALSLWVYVRTSAPVVCALFFSQGGTPLVQLLQRSRAPHFFRMTHPIDHVTLSLASLPGNLGQAGTLGLPLEGSSLTYAKGSAAPRGDGYVMLSSVDQPAEYIAPPLDLAPRFVAHYSVTVPALTSVTLPNGVAVPVQSVTRVDLINAGVPGTNAALKFDVDADDAFASTSTNIRVAGTIVAAQAGLWALAAGQAESIDIDMPPGSAPYVVVENDDATLPGLCVVNMWGY